MAHDEASQQKSNKKFEQEFSKEQLKSLDDKLKPLDGGYGWLIVIGSFVINFICELS